MRAQRADLERRDRMLQVIDRAGRRGEVQDVVDRPVDLERMRDVVADEGEAVVAAQMLDVGRAAGDEVIDADDFVALGAGSARTDGSRRSPRRR